MRQHRLVGRVAARRRRGQQRRVEPAAVLVRALEVEVDLLARRQQLALGHRRPRHTRLEPDVDDVVLLVERAPAAGAGRRVRRQQLGGRPREPRVRALATEDLRHVLDNLGVEQILPAFRAAERRNRHAPDALARQAPVGARLDHAADAVLAPGRDPLRLRDLGQRAVAQRRLVGGVAETGEPLLGRAEDDRVVAAPAVRVLVAHRLARLVQQEAARRQIADDLGLASRHLAHPAQDPVDVVA